MPAYSSRSGQHRTGWHGTGPDGMGADWVADWLITSQPIFLVSLHASTLCPHSFAGRTSCSDLTAEDLQLLENFLLGLQGVPDGGVHVLHDLALSSGNPPVSLHHFDLS